MMLGQGWHLRGVAQGGAPRAEPTPGLTVNLGKYWEDEVEAETWACLAHHCQVIFRCSVPLSAKWGQ